MQRISRAPELSATLSLDSCWIMRWPLPVRRARGGDAGRAGQGRRAQPLVVPKASPRTQIQRRHATSSVGAWGGEGSSRLLHHLDQAPALGLRQRPGLDHAHHVALAGLVALVVGVQRPRAADHLLVDRVATDDVDPHRDRFLPLVGDDDPLAHLGGVGVLLRGRRPGARGSLLLRLRTLLAPRLGLPLALGRTLLRPLLDRKPRPSFMGPAGPFKPPLLLPGKLILRIRLRLFRRSFLLGGRRFSFLLRGRRLSLSGRSLLSFLLFGRGVVAGRLRLVRGWRGGWGLARSLRGRVAILRDRTRGLSALVLSRSLLLRRLLSYVFFLVVRHLFPQLSIHVDPALPGHGQQPRDVLLRPPQPRRVLQLAGGVPEAQVERLFLGVDQPGDQLAVFQVVRLGGLHRFSAPSRMTKRVLTGSLCPARRSASRASSSGTPASSNITFPGLTTATQPSGLPLPDPIRVSAGFLV